MDLIFENIFGIKCLQAFAVSGGESLYDVDAPIQSQPAHKTQDAMIDALRENESLWGLFTSKEEYDPQVLDMHRRFPYYLSKHRDVLEPRVSEFLIRNGLKVEYPGGKGFAVCLTHDIDVVYFSGFKLPYQVAVSLRGRRLRRSLAIALHRLSKKINPIWNFEQIMNLERKYHAKSSFYFLALERGEQDFNFRLEDLKGEMRNIIDSGWEVGLHGGHQAYNNLDVIKREKERLERIVGRELVGYRNHYLRFEVPATWELLKEAGFKYDATFGYADCVGFRNGMCHPFKPFNLNTNEFVDILEIPLAIMDCTLDDYMRLELEEAWRISKRLIDTVERQKGVISILWHNTYMVDETLRLYEKILRYCHKKGAWMTSGEEIWRWWDQNNLVDGWQ